jgi:hypothetical protein
MLEAWCRLRWQAGLVARRAISDGGHVFCKAVGFSIASRRTSKLNDLRGMASRMCVDCVDG